MGPDEIVEILIQADGTVCARSLIEVSIHLPRRGTRWIASFRDETGRQVWRTTGLRDHKRALALAKEWEAEAKSKRAAQGALPRKPTIRVRRGSGEEAIGLMTQREVATIMRISERAVREIERRAFEKLRRHLRDVWREWLTGEVEESALQIIADWTLTRAEIAAVNDLAETPEERKALRKLLAMVGS